MKKHSEEATVEAEAAINVPVTMEAAAPRQHPFSAKDDMHLSGLDPSLTINVVSEFSGIGAFEHGLQAGFDEAGISFRLIEACELESTGQGRHAAAVLRKRFPHCQVLNPAQRQARAYPSHARMLDVTAQCTEHSPLNTSREPWLTEETMLEPVIERLRNAPQIEVVVLENVPNLAKALDGQVRSSYTMWVEGLQSVGFTEHAYVTLPTSASGDLHHRVRLLSVHTRGAFHPAAALLRLIEEEDPGIGTQANDQKQSMDEKGSALAERTSEVFAFTTGLSETRATFKGRVGTTFGSLPAYNTGLNCALYVRGKYYKLSPWLASRCSGLPDGYQDGYWHEANQWVKLGPATDGSALGNMVSPLQGRELGNAIASEWRRPRKLADVDVLRDAETLPLEVRDVPTEFPFSRKGVNLCFSSSHTRRWHRVAVGSWRRVAPARTLDQLCDDALANGKLHPMTNLTDLNRLVDDEMLLPTYRDSAAKQYIRIQKAANEELRLASYDARHKKKRVHMPTTSCIWAQCDNCLSWRRLDLPPAAADQLPERWTCSMNPNPPFNRCEVAEEEMMEREECRSGWVEVSEPYSGENDRWLFGKAAQMENLQGGRALKERLVHDCHGSEFSPLACDYYMKSRPHEELESRVEYLRELRAGSSSMTLTESQGTDATAEPIAEPLLLEDPQPAIPEEGRQQADERMQPANEVEDSVAEQEEGKQADDKEVDDKDEAEGGGTGDEAAGEAAEGREVAEEANAAGPQDSPHQLASGTQVMARYNAKDPGPFLAKRFYAGRITRSNADGTYNINYDDGDTELNVPLRFIKVAGEAGAAEEDEVEDEEKHERVAIKVLSHLFHPGARLGSPDDVYVRLRYSDGTMNGGYYIPLEQLCASIKGPEVLVKYCSTEHGQTLRGYVPPYVLSAGMPPTDVELAVGQGMTDASRCCALAYAKAAERVSQAEVERYERWCATHPTATETGWDRSDTDAVERPRYFSELT